MFSNKVNLVIKGIMKTLVDNNPVVGEGGQMI